MGSASLCYCSRLGDVLAIAKTSQAKREAYGDRFDDSVLHHQIKCACNSEQVFGEK